MRAALAAATLLVATPAIAGDDTPQNSVTFSPIHLLMPVVEVNYERSLTDLHAVALMGGRGSISNYSVTEVGLQYRAYVLGDFGTGLGVGAEGVALRIDTAGVVGTGYSGGPMLTGKATAGFGLTGVLDIGYQFVKASATDGDQSASQSGGSVLLNLNLGWSF